MLQRTRSLEAPAVAAIVILALVLRVWGFDWGLWHPDEGKTVAAAIDVTRGRLEPDYATYSYGALNIYWNGAALAAWRAANPPPATAATEPAAVSARAHRVLRVVSAIASTLTLLALLWLGRRLLGTGAALLAMALLAPAFLAVQCAHYVTPDSLLALLATISLGFSARVLLDGRNRDAVAAGLFSGLAGATKFTGILAIGSLLAAAFASRRGPARGVRLVAFGLVGAAAGYVIGDPFSVIHFRSFAKESFLMQREIYGEEIGKSLWDRGPDPSVVWNLRYLAQVSPGVWVILLAAIGAALCFRRDKRVALFLATQPALFFALYSAFPLRFDRNLLVFHPSLALLAGFAMSQAAGGLSRRAPAPLVAAGLACAVLLLVTPPVLRAVAFDREIRRETTHEQLRSTLAQLTGDGKGAVMLYHKPAALDRSYREWASQGIRFVVLVSKVRDPLMRQPEQHPDWAEHVREVERECALVATIRNPLFDAGAFAPKSLEPSATAAPYHDPTYWIYRVPDDATRPGS